MSFPSQAALGTPGSETPPVSGLVGRGKGGAARPRQIRQPEGRDTAQTTPPAAVAAAGGREQRVLQPVPPSQATLHPPVILDEARTQDGRCREVLPQVAPPPPPQLVSLPHF